MRSGKIKPDISDCIYFRIFQVNAEALKNDLQAESVQIQIRKVRQPRLQS